MKKMTSLMFEDETTIFQPADFPDYYVDNHHPEDYISTKEPIQELIYHNYVSLVKP